MVVFQYIYPLSMKAINIFFSKFHSYFIFIIIIKLDCEFTSCTQCNSQHHYYPQRARTTQYEMESDEFFWFTDVWSFCQCHLERKNSENIEPTIILTYSQVLYLIWHISDRVVAENLSQCYSPPPAAHR